MNINLSIINLITYTIGMDEPNIDKWSVKDDKPVKRSVRVPQTPDFMPNDEVSDLIPLNTLNKPEVINQKVDYNGTWINNELRLQLNMLISNPDLKTKIELYENLPYSIRTFSRRKSKVPQTLLTDDLQQKINEILEARLVKSGYTMKNWPFIIFLLKNNHGYQDTRNIETDTNVTFNVTRGAISSVKGKRKQVKATITPVK